MSLKEKAKNKAEQKIKKIVFKVLKPFLPFIIIIIGLFFAICSIIDAIFIQEVQTDPVYMEEIQKDTRQKCIEKAEYLNTCDNYKDGEKTEYLLDIDNREIDKVIEWSHLYAIMAFHNMTENATIDEELLNKISEKFISTFKYETMIIKEETSSTDEERKYNNSYNRNYCLCISGK